MPILEKILAAVKRNLTIENCCDQLRAILMLKRIIKLKTKEDDEECYPEVRTLSQWPIVYLVTSELYSYDQLQAIKYFRSRTIGLTASRD